MKITKTSVITGKVNTMDLDVTLQELSAWEHGALIQNVMPHLTASEREFLISGVTDAEWVDFLGLDMEDAQ